ncbi:MAG: hypothetical protein H6557_17315 [Lewinellaceae bacterium]|nr:hypothetical protein [Phaeodactylibacter sp.]MCB9038378.1 hypothetical protein [Lewinellaceae bacterium]
MQNTLAYQLLRTFAKQDIREARKWLASPYHNQREDLPLLFEQLAAAAPEGQPLPRKQAWQAVYPNRPYDDQQLRLLLSYLYRCLEDFLLQRETEQAPWLQQHLLLAAYRKRGLDSHFQKAYRKLHKHQRAETQRPPEYHLARYWLEQERYQEESTLGRTREHNLQELEDQLTCAFLSMKLRQGCFLLAHEAVYKASYRIALEEALLGLATQEPYRDIPAISVYCHCYRMLRFPEQDQYFTTFQSRLFQSIGLFPQAELRDLFLLAINFCIRQINQTAEGYLREALELYQKGLETEVLLENGDLSRFTYNNAIGIALRLQEFDWAERFLHHYRPYLEAEQEEAAFSLNAARLAFARRQYGQVLAHLQRADYRDLINNMVAKTLQMKAYYELDEFDLLESHLRSMRAFLRRKRHISYHQQNYLNIIRYTQKLLALNPMDREMAKALEEEIRNVEPLTEKGWLVEKVGNI